MMLTFPWVRMKDLRRAQEFLTTFTVSIDESPAEFRKHMGVQGEDLKQVMK